jgi:ABC-type bacteriocin/lantibiotic exporter with double-glycine peptidase domain
MRTPDGRAMIKLKMEKPKRSESLKTLMPEVLALMRPRRGLLLAGAVLMLINRVCGLALPYSTKYLVNDVMLKGQFKLLMPIV